MSSLGKTSDPVMDTRKKDKIITSVSTRSLLSNIVFADKAIAELEDELLREERDHSPLSENTLVIATTRLNSRLRQRGLSSRELWTQRSQFTHEQLPISDMNLIRAQHEARNKNHGFSEISKCSRPGRPTPDITIGDLVYLYTDRSKTQSRDRYLVVARDGEWCFIKKFSGNQLRASSYKVKLSECYKVLNTISAQQNPRYSQNVYNQESDSDDHDEDSLPGPIRDLPPDRAEPPPILICENIDDVENLDEPTAQPDNSLEHDLTLSNSSNEQDNKRVLRTTRTVKDAISEHLFIFPSNNGMSKTALSQYLHHEKCILQQPNNLQSTNGEAVTIIQPYLMPEEQFIYCINDCKYFPISRNILACLEFNKKPWATQFLADVSSGTIKSTTEAKDAATILWRQHSSSYDSKRAVQLPSEEAGHVVKRKRKSTETEYE
ncbi:unnamed protein product [Mytilus edulis]|uniref:Uncharacterized protein n=1 Tax=Mytilus edulis TaxID=6550 RepID=A0A8S3QYM3_MYTED|nr:unnamed protein product [Mytilus edulis]